MHCNLTIMNLYSKSVIYLSECIIKEVGTERSPPAPHQGPGVTSIKYLSFIFLTHILKSFPTHYFLSVS